MRLACVAIALFLVACSSGGGFFIPKNLDGGTDHPMHDGGTQMNGPDMAQKAASCNDGVQNGNETDIDCGGSCDPCGVEKHCKGSPDCQSMNCQTGTCAPGASCNDGIKNQGESDIDCGGPCPACADFAHCNTNTDCQSNNCSSGTCAAAPNCFDGVKNGTETDVDCGGSCSSCGDGLMCKKSADCTDANCSNQLCCAQGFGNCNANAGDGCEASLMSDSNNCGTCGHVCPNNTPSCSNGACVAQAPCDVATEVSYNGHCYYLDGNGGICDGGYVLASQTVFTNIATSFAGKTYKHKLSDNCCIKNADAVENYGMAGHCNAAGPFAAQDIQLGADGCTGQVNANPAQLTLCMK
jgi:hypothetical protein